MGYPYPYFCLFAFWGPINGNQKSGLDQRPDSKHSTKPQTWRFMGSSKGSFKGSFKGIFRDAIRAPLKGSIGIL